LADFVINRQIGLAFAPAMSRRQIKSTAAELINARATPHEARIRLAERDRRLATEDTRTEAERWLGDPPPWQSALAQRSAQSAIRPRGRIGITLPTLLPVEFSRLVDIGRSKRQEIARELVNGRGMSRRQAAKLLGVGEATVRRDVRNDSTNGAEKLRTTRELLAQSN
jgi:hypothetical protein